MDSWPDNQGQRVMVVAGGSHISQGVDRHGPCSPLSARRTVYQLVQRLPPMNASSPSMIRLPEPLPLCRSTTAICSFSSTSG